MNITWRTADIGTDIPLLAAWNQQLIRDQGHRNPMVGPALAERMQGWLGAAYRAIVFADGADPVGYALYRPEDRGIHLRQFFIRPESRRRGGGRACFELLRREVWPKGTRLTVDVLCHNAAGVGFWRAVGFRDYALTLEIVPPDA